MSPLLRVTIELRHPYSPRGITAAVVGGGGVAWLKVIAALSFGSSDRFNAFQLAAAEIPEVSPKPPSAFAADLAPVYEAPSAVVAATWPGSRISCDS